MSIISPNEPIEPGLPRFNSLVMEALVGGDKTFTQPIRRHWKKLGSQEAVSFLSDGTHIAQQEFSRDHMIKMLGHQRAALVEALQHVDDVPAFKAACLKFIDREMNTLFFVTNDETQAQLARDYFDTFMDGLVARMGKGAKQEKLAGLCRDLKDYYGIALAGYQVLSEDLLMFSSQGNPDHPHATRSLVQCALMADAKTPQQQEAALALLADKEAALDPQKYLRMENSSRIFFCALMAQRYGAHYDRAEDAQPIDAWVQQRIETIAAHMHRDEIDHQPDTPQAYEAMQKIVLKEERRLLNSLSRNTGNLEEPGYRVEVARQLDRMQANVAHLPLDFPETLPSILRLARDDAYKSIPALVNGYAARIALRPVPVANARTEYPMPMASLAERSIPGTILSGSPDKEELGCHARWVRDTLTGIMGGFNDELAQAHSLEDIRNGENVLLNSIANTVYFGPFSPVSLLYAQQYFKDVRQEIEGYLHETGHHDMQKDMLKSMGHIEEKCRQLYEGFFAASDWMMDLTNGAHDRAVLPAYLSEAVASGKTWAQLSTEEQRSNIQPRAQQVLHEAVQSKGINLDFCNPLIPYLFEKCVEIATHEQAETQTPANAALPLKTARGKFTKRLLEQSQPASSDLGIAAQMSVKDRSHALFEQALGLMPQNEFMFSPDHCALIEDFLQKELARAQAWAAPAPEASGYGRH